MPLDVIFHDSEAPEPPPGVNLPMRARRASPRFIGRSALRHTPVAPSCEERSLGGNGANFTSRAKTQVEPMNWRLGLVTDRGGHVRLGAVVAANDTEPPVYVDLLAAIGAASAAELDLDRLVVLVRGEDVTHLRRLVERCIDDHRLRNRLIELTNLSTSHILRTK